MILCQGWALGEQPSSSLSICRREFVSLSDSWWWMFWSAAARLSVIISGSSKGRRCYCYCRPNAHNTWPLNKITDRRQKQMTHVGLCSVHGDQAEERITVTRIAQLWQNALWEIFLFYSMCSISLKTGACFAQEMPRCLNNRPKALDRWRSGWELLRILNRCFDGNLRQMLRRRQVGSNFFHNVKDGLLSGKEGRPDKN